MNYSLGNMLGRRMALASLDPDAKGYIDAVVAAGGTVSGGQKSAINTFVKTGKSADWYSSLKRMYLPIWGVAAPNAIDMVELGSGTFNGTVTHAAGYVQVDGLTGYFDVGAPLATIGCTLNSTSFGGLATGTSATAIVRFLGVQDSSNTTRSILSSSVGTAWLARISSSSAATSATLTELRGVVLASRSSSATVNVWQRVASGITRPINEAALASNTLNATASAVFFANNNNGVVSQFSSATQQTGAMFIGTGFTNTEAEGFTLALKNLWEGTTGLTLP
jgi:hypothetical protein